MTKKVSPKPSKAEIESAFATIGWQCAKTNKAKKRFLLYSPDKKWMMFIYHVSGTWLLELHKQEMDTVGTAYYVQYFEGLEEFPVSWECDSEDEDEAYNTLKECVEMLPSYIKAQEESFE
jgi:hypothetical protein